VVDHLLVLYAADERTVTKLAEKLLRALGCRVLGFALAAGRRPAVFWC
jgi:hypothetical protein